MFPLRERSRTLVIVSGALLIAALLVTILNHAFGINMKPQQSEQTIVGNLKDNWELQASGKTVKTDNAVKIEKTAYPLNRATDSIVNRAKTATKERLGSLAKKYKADPDYLDYIVKVEKTFELEPCELLAIIAQESGFKPQTHMDGGSLSYSTTQMKMATAKTAYMAITEYYKMDIPYPTHDLLNQDKNYAAFLAGGYLRYLHDTYKDKYESYTAYNWGIGGRMIFYKNNGHFKSPYAMKVASLGKSFHQYVGEEYDNLRNSGEQKIDPATFHKAA